MSLALSYQVRVLAVLVVAGWCVYAAWFGLGSRRRRESKNPWTSASILRDQAEGWTGFGRKHGRNA